MSNTSKSEGYVFDCEQQHMRVIQKVYLLLWSMVEIWYQCMNFYLNCTVFLEVSIDVLINDPHVECTHSEHATRIYVK